MTKFCDVEKFKSAYEHKVGVQFDNAIHEMEKDKFCADVILILKGATNGEMFSKTFPNLRIEDKGGSIYVHYPDGGWIMFDREWWFSPYKKKSV